MLFNLAWSEVWLAWWISFCAGVVVFIGFSIFGVPADFSMIGRAAFVGSAVLPFFLVCAVVVAGPLFMTEVIMGGSELPERFRPTIERPDKPWRKRTPVRHIEVLKGELGAAEDRLALLATLDGYIRYYEEVKETAAPGTDIDQAKGYLFILERAYRYFDKHCAGDEWRIPQLIERIDAIYGGDVTADIRGLEERIEALQLEIARTDPDSKSAIQWIGTQIRSCERDIAELKSWQASLTKTEVKTPQRERFEHAKTVEYDNERIEIWARHAKFKAYEEQLAMRRDEIEKIERRVARGELTRREADYLLRKLDEYFGEQDDRVFV